MLSLVLQPRNWFPSDTSVVLLYIILGIFAIVYLAAVYLTYTLVAIITLIITAISCIILFIIIIKKREIYGNKTILNILGILSLIIYPLFIFSIGLERIYSFFNPTTGIFVVVTPIVYMTLESLPLMGILLFIGFWQIILLCRTEKTTVFRLLLVGFQLLASILLFVALCVLKFSTSFAARLTNANTGPGGYLIHTSTSLILHSGSAIINWVILLLGFVFILAIPISVIVGVFKLKHDLKKPERITFLQAFLVLSGAYILSQSGIAVVDFFANAFCHFLSFILGLLGKEPSRRVAFLAPHVFLWARMLIWTIMQLVIVVEMIVIVFEFLEIQKEKGGIERLKL